MVKKSKLGLGLIAGAMLAMTGTASVASTVKNVDLVFVIDRSGSMSGEGATLSARIGEVMTGIQAGLATAGFTGTVEAGVISYASNSSASTGAQLVSAITSNVSALQTAISGISYSGSNEDGLGALASALPGGSFFGSLGYRDGTVRSLVLLTDEDDDSPAPNDYVAFRNSLGGYLNNVIVSNQGSRCQGLGGTSTGGGCEYIPSANPTSGFFDLVDFTVNTDAFLQGFISAKVGEIIITPPVGQIPLPAAGWLMIAGLGGLMAVKRRQKKQA